MEGSVLLPAGKEDILVGYRWHDTKKIKPLFAFGEGLSYTTFEISKLDSDKKAYSKDESIVISGNVSNKGNADGAEVVQVYIGKLNSILKGLAGNPIELVTVSDSDVLFLNGWQSETNRVFAQVPKAGVVGIVPQFTTYTSNSGNVIMDNLFSSKMHFIPVKNKAALVRFYESVG